MKTTAMSLISAAVLAVLLIPAARARTAPGGKAWQASQDQQPAEQPADKKKDKKKKKNEQSEGGTPDADAATRRNVSRVLQDLGDGFEGHSSRRVTELLDDKFEDLPRFEDAVTQFLEGTSEMRVYLRQSTNEVKGDHATVIVDAEMIYTDKSRPTQDQRRRERIQFDFVYDQKKGWKIFEITPRNFFEP